MVAIITGRVPGYPQSSHRTRAPRQEGPQGGGDGGHGNLRGHPEHCSQQQPMDVPTAQRRNGAPEVGQLHVPFVGHEDVGAFDVPVDDVPVVEVLQPAQDLPQVVAEHGLRQGPEVAEEGREGAARDVLQEDGEGARAVGAQVFDDVGMVQCAQHGHLRLDRGGLRDDGGCLNGVAGVDLV